MKQTVEKIDQHFYSCKYQVSGGKWSTRYYGIFTDWKGKRRKLPLGADLNIARRKLDRLKGENAAEKDFDAEKIKPDEGMTVAKWADSYLELEEIKTKRSFTREGELVATIKRLLGSVLLTDVKREHLFKYKSQRLQERIIRNGKEAAKLVSAGTVANELSCFRHMLNKARENEIEAAAPSFAGLIQRSKRDRILDAKEESAMLKTYPAWLRRIAIVARETCLSEGDIIRLTKPMIDRQRREIVPAGGRVKTGVEQRAPLTDRVLQVLDEIEQEKRRGNIVANVNGFVFTRNDGRAINKDMITQAIRLARKRAGVSDFRFHDYRHSAKTEWSRQGVHVDVAMKAAGHNSVAMHQRYVNLKPGDVARAFGICSNGVQTNPADKSAANVNG